MMREADSSMGALKSLCMQRSTLANISFSSRITNSSSLLIFEKFKMSAFIYFFSRHLYILQKSCSVMLWEPFKASVTSRPPCVGDWLRCWSTGAWLRLVCVAVCCYFNLSYYSFSFVLAFISCPWFSLVSPDFIENWGAAAGLFGVSGVWSYFLVSSCLFRF